MPSVTLYAFDIVGALLQGRLSGAQMGWSQRQGGQCGSSVDGSGQCGGPDGPRERVQTAQYAWTTRAEDHAVLTRESLFFRLG